MEKPENEEYLKLYVLYKKMRELFYIADDSEIFQLKMMICAKFKFYEYNKVIIMNKGNIISNYDDKLKIREVLNSNIPQDKELEICIIYNTDSKEHLFEYDESNRVKNEMINNSLNALSIKNIMNKKLTSNNINYNNINLTSIEFNSNSNSDMNSISKCSANSNNIANSICKINLNLNSSQNSLIKEKSILSELNVKNFITCNCVEGNEALYICLKCNSYLCKKCLKQEPHLFHNSEIIKISNSLDSFKYFLEDISQKLNDNLINDENWIYLQNFETFFLDFKNSIEKNFNNILNILEDLKASEIDYLMYFKEKINIDEKFFDLNKNIEFLIEEFLNLNEEDNNIFKFIDFRKKIVNKYEEIVKQHDILKQYYTCFLNSIEEIENFNNRIIGKFEGRYSAAKQLFNVDNINKRLSLMNISKYYYLIFNS